MKVTSIEMIGLLRGKCVPRDMKVNESLAAYLVRQFDDLHEKREAAERERDELRVEAEKYVELSGRNAARAQKAEAELARRDAAAGEAVAYQIHSDLEGWLECTPERYKEVAARPIIHGKHSGGWLVRKLFTAQPAVLPPEITPTQAEALTFRNPFDFSNGANWMRDQVKALGCQPEKVVMLPSIDNISIPPSLALSGNDTVLFMQQYEHYVKEALDVAGVKWEVVK